MPGLVKLLHLLLVFQNFKVQRYTIFCNPHRFFVKNNVRPRHISQPSPLISFPEAFQSITVASITIVSITIVSSSFTVTSITVEPNPAASIIVVPFPAPKQLHYLLIKEPFLYRARLSVLLKNKFAERVQFSQSTIYQQITNSKSALPIFRRRGKADCIFLINYQ